MWVGDWAFSCTSGLWLYGIEYKCLFFFSVVLFEFWPKHLVVKLVSFLRVACCREEWWWLWHVQRSSTDKQSSCRNSLAQESWYRDLAKDGLVVTQTFAIFSEFGWPLGAAVYLSQLCHGLHRHKHRFHGICCWGTGLEGGGEIIILLFWILHFAES